MILRTSGLRGVAGALEGRGDAQAQGPSLELTLDRPPGTRPYTRHLLPLLSHLLMPHLPEIPSFTSAGHQGAWLSGPRPFSL